MPEQRLMHFGFARPFIDGVAVAVVIGLCVRPGWLAVFVAIMELCDRWVLRRVDRRIAEWAESHGFFQVERRPRGGSVSWGWTLISTAEMYDYRAFDSDSRERRIIASYQSDALGLRLRTFAEADITTGGGTA